MKQMKFYVVALVAMMGISLTSCMNSDSESNYDDAAFVTVYDRWGMLELTIDNSNVKLIPMNPDALKLRDGSYPERAFVYYKYAEGVKPTQGQTSYNVTIVAGEGIPVVDVNLRPDTIKNSYIVRELGIWKSSGYINTAVTVPCSDVPSFAIYIDTANVDKAKNLLPLVLKCTKGGSTYGTPYIFYNSLDVNSIEVSGTGLELNPNDSVTVRVTTNVDTGSGETPISKEMKYKFSY